MSFGRRLLRNGYTIVWVLIAGLVILFGIYQISAGSAVMGAIVGVVGNLMHRLESRPDRLGFARERLEKLYGPNVPRAKSTIAAVQGNSTPFMFAQQMDALIGGSLRHLALDATLTTYEASEERDADEDAWARHLARVFLEDHNRLVKQFRDQAPK